MGNTQNPQLKGLSFVKNHLITFKLIDKDDDQKVSEKEFMEYINLIIAAVKKVQGANRNIYLKQNK